jgi:glycosyltransferase involved in cell wall biosynthesis
MRICHITTVHPPFDGRIFHKECRSLAKAGNEVFLVAPYDKDEEVDGIKMRAIKKQSNPFVRILISPPKAFFRAQATKSDVYHLHDPELLLLGMFFFLLGKKTIFDSHENVGEQILTKEYIPTRILRSIVAFFYGLIEKFCALFLSGVVAVNEDIRKRFAFKKNTVIIRNYPMLDKINQQQNITVPESDLPLVIYAGGLTRIRGIKEIIEAMSMVDAELWLLGPWETEEYRKECTSLPSWDKCNYFGNLPFGEQYAYLRVADIGIVMFYPEKNHVSSLPNKIFEYMACDIALVMSNFAFWKENFSECAIFADPLDPTEIAEKINTLLKDKDLSDALAAAGLKTVNEKYSWEAESKKLIAFYDKIFPMGKSKNTQS